MTDLTKRGVRVTGILGVSKRKEAVTSGAPVPLGKAQRAALKTIGEFGTTDVFVLPKNKCSARGLVRNKTLMSLVDLGLARSVTHPNTDIDYFLTDAGAAHYKVYASTNWKVVVTKARAERAAKTLAKSRLAAKKKAKAARTAKTAKTSKAKSKSRRATAPAEQQATA